MPRGDGVRGIYVAPEGHALFACDYSQLELCALAETCYRLYGKSKLLELINASVDLHKWFGYEVLMVKTGGNTQDGVDYRQMAKACYSADTELLTRDGWRRIDELYGQDVEVMQYNPDNKECSLTYPLDWVKKDNQPLIAFKNDYMDLLVTPDHRMLTLDREGVPKEILASYLKANENLNCVHGGNHVYKHEFSDLETRLAVMIQADGNYHGNKVRLGFSKARKIERCRYLLEQACIPYTETKTSEGVVSFTVNKGSWLRLSDTKEFKDWYLYHPLSFIDELWRWDGSTYGKHPDKAQRHGKSYFSTSKKCVDIAQTILVVNGYKCGFDVQKYSKPQKNPVYSIRWYTGDGKKNKTYARLSGLQIAAVPGSHTVYCLSVPSSWLLVRRNGKVVVQGNCNFGE